MFASITLFELRYQLKNPVFWVVSVLFFLLTFGSVTVDEIQIGSGGNVHVNSPAAITQIHLILSLFFMFVTTAFVANVVVRDDESGFGTDGAGNAGEQVRLSDRAFHRRLHHSGAGLFVRAAGDLCGLADAVA